MCPTLLTSLINTIKKKKKGTRKKCNFCGLESTSLCDGCCTATECKLQIVNESCSDFSSLDFSVWDIISWCLWDKEKKKSSVIKSTSLCTDAGRGQLRISEYINTLFHKEKVCLHLWISMENALENHLYCIQNQNLSI